MNASRGISRRFVSVIGFACALLLTLAACRGSDDDDGGTATEGIKLIKDGKLTVCTHLPYKPFQFSDGGEIVGFDVDLLNLLADDLGVEQEVLDIGWDTIVSGDAMRNKQCDVAMGGMTITSERAAAMTISEPYFEATQALLVRADSGIESIEDLDGATVGVQTSTTGEIYGNDQKDKYGFTPKTYEDFSLEVNAVKAGTIDAAINDNGVLYDFVKDNPETAVVQEFDTGEEYGFGAAQDENAKKLISRLNSLIANARDDGTYDEIYEKWFGELSKELQ